MIIHPQYRLTQSGTSGCGCVHAGVRAAVLDVDGVGVARVSALSPGACSMQHQCMQCRHGKRCAATWAHALWLWRWQMLGLLASSGSNVSTSMSTQCIHRRVPSAALLIIGLDLRSCRVHVANSGLGPVLFLCHSCSSWAMPEACLWTCGSVYMHVRHATLKRLLPCHRNFGDSTRSSGGWRKPWQTRRQSFWWCTCKRGPIAMCTSTENDVHKVPTVEVGVPSVHHRLNHPYPYGREV